MATKRRKATKRRRRNAPMSALQAKYFGGAKKKRRRRNPLSLLTYTRKRKVANPPKRRRRTHHRRNPQGFSVQNIIQSATRGLMDGASVVAGKTAVRVVSSRFDYADGSMMDSVVELAAALGLGIIGPRIVGQDRARLLVAGGFASVIETLVAQAQIPHVSGLLGATAPVSTRAFYSAADAPYLLRSGALGVYAKRAAGQPRQLLTSGKPLLGMYAQTPTGSGNVS